MGEHQYEVDTLQNTVEYSQSHHISISRNWARHELREGGEWRRKVEQSADKPPRTGLVRYLRIIDTTFTQQIETPIFSILVLYLINKYI